MPLRGNMPIMWMTHDNLILQSVRAEQERLQNDMSLAYQVYSQVATQLQMHVRRFKEEKPRICLWWSQLLFRFCHRVWEEKCTYWLLHSFRF